MCRQSLFDRADNANQQLEWLAQTYDLSAFDLDLILLALSTELDLRYERIFAYLQVIVLGLKGLRIEANARRIQEDLARLGGDVAKLRQPLATLGRHLGNAQKQYEDAQRELDRLETKLDEIGRKGADGTLHEREPEPPTLPGVV